MDNKTKLILSVIGVGAIIIPLALLFFLTSKATKEPATAPIAREIDKNGISSVVSKTQKQQAPILLPSPTPSSPSAKPASEGSKSAR